MPSTFNYDTLTALINVKYMPTMINQVFKNHYLMKMLKDKAKTFNGRKIHVPLEYADSTENVAFTSAYEVLNLHPVEIATGADYEPKMMTGHITISKEEELVMDCEEAVKNILTAKMNNLVMSMDKSAAQNLWTRTQNAKGWNTLDTIVNTTALGGIPATGDVPSWWKSRIIDLADGTKTGDPSLEADLTDPAKGVYIKKILQELVAKSRHLNNENPDLILVGQYLWDMLEFILDPQKKGSPLTAKLASMGFDAIDFRGIPIIADEDMVAAQTGDTDGRIYALNLKYLYMFFNAKAKFAAGKFIEPINQSARAAKIHAYGNLITSNRFVQASAKNILSKKSYAA